MKKTIIDTRATDPGNHSQSALRSACVIPKEIDVVPTTIGPHPGSELHSVRSFRQEVAVVPSTIWRWQQKGWLPAPINIGGRMYYTHAQLDEFRRRAAAGEFAANVQPPKKKGGLS